MNDPSKLKLAIPIKNWDKNVMPKFDKISKENDINDSTKSQTIDCNEYLFEVNRKRFYFIDTPGLNDTNGIANDNNNFQSFLQACKKSQFINGVILILNGTNQRLSVDIKNLYENFKRFFPAKLNENVILVFTNFNESSCNFDLNYLSKIVKHKSCYFMQNNFLNFDKKKLKGDSKRLKCLELDWNESLETIINILNDISSLSSISTNTFKNIEKMTENIFTNVNEQLQMILDYLKNCLSLKLQQQIIIESIENMSKNCVHETDHQIEAISFQTDEKVILNVKLKNNKAITQYNDSKNELELSKRNCVCLDNDIKKTENKISELIYNLAKEAQNLREECTGFNFIHQFHSILSRLNEVSVSMPYFQIYVDKIFAILGEVDSKVYRTNSNSRLTRKKWYKCCQCNII